MSDNHKSRFERYKARYDGGMPRAIDRCQIEALFDHLHQKVHDAMEKFEESPHRDRDWIRVGKNAEKLLNLMPKQEKAESVMIIFVFLKSLDVESFFGSEN